MISNTELSEYTVVFQRNGKPFPLSTTFSAGNLAEAWETAELYINECMTPNIGDGYAVHTLVETPTNQWD